jgi:Fe-S-cluster containining protein
MKCKRCGTCCDNMALGVSPEELKKYYYNWKDDVKDTDRASSIDLIYPMLIFKGYDKKVKRYRYKCKHLIRKGKKAICSIYPIRPDALCAQYGLRENMTMGIVGSINNQLYPGCVF